MKHFLFFFALLLFFTQPTLSATFEEGLRAYEDKDHNAAFNIWYPLAKAGQVSAQTYLGHLYAEGKGVGQDSEEAFYWYEQAADNNFPAAQFALGVMFAKGVAVRKDYDEANEWYLLAANQEFAPAQNNLGQHYEQGLGFDAPDIEKALAWYRRAAEQGFAASQANLGLYYFRQGNLDQSRRWLRLAAERDILQAQVQLAELWKNRNALEASYWYGRAAQQGSQEAQRELGLMFLQGGKGLRASYFKGVAFLGAAAKKGDSIAQTMLAKIYLNGKLVERDVAEARRLLEEAAKQNYVPAFLELGKFYSEKKFVPRNWSQAQKWLEQAIKAGAEQGEGDAYYYLGKGFLTEGDREAAKENLLRAGNLGSSRALIALGNIYLGQGDVGAARRYLEIAAAKGNRVAQYNLGMSWTYRSKKIQPNLSEALKWLLLSEAQGFKRAKEAVRAIRNNLTPEQIARAEGQARDLQKKN